MSVAQVIDTPLLKKPMRHYFLLSSLLVCSVISGCVTMQVDQLKIMAARPDTQNLTILVDKTSFNEAGEAVALENGLKRKFLENGYLVIEKNGLELRAHIKNLVRGNTFANVFVGLGVGKDAVEVEIELWGTKELLMSFTVKSEVLDKRYADLNTVLTKSLPAKVVKQVQEWESAKR